MKRGHVARVAAMVLLMLAAHPAAAGLQVLPSQHLLVITAPAGTDTPSPGTDEFRRLLQTKYGYAEQEITLQELSTSAILSELFRARERIATPDEVIIYWKLPARREEAYTRQADDLSFFLRNELPRFMRTLSSGPKLVILDSCDMEGRREAQLNSQSSRTSRGQEVTVSVCSVRSPPAPLEFIAKALAERTRPFNVIDLLEPLFEADPPAVIIGELPAYQNALVLRPAGKEVDNRLVAVINGQGPAELKVKAIDELVVTALTPEQFRQALEILSSAAVNREQPVEVRRYALQRIGRMGFSDTPDSLRRYLLDSSDGEDRDVREDAVLLIDTVRPRDAMEIFAAIATKQQPPASIAAIHAVTRFSNRESAQVLAAVLDADAGERNHIAALDGVAVLNERPPELGAAVLRRLKDKDDDVRAAAVAALVSVVEYEAKQPRSAAGLGRTALDAIVAAAGDSDTTVRYSVAFALGRVEKIKSGQPVIAQTLDKLSRDPYARVREAAVAGLGTLSNQRGAPRVLELLADPDSDVRVAAVGVTMQLRLTSAAPRLRPLLKDEDVVVRGVAANALGALGDKESLPALQELATRDPDTQVRMLAGQAAEVLRGACVNPDSSDLVSKEAGSATRVRAISGICPSDYTRALPVLLGLLDDESFEVRTAAADALAKYPARSLLPAAQNVLAKGNSIERISMARALGRSNDAEASRLLSQIDDQETDVRLAMIEAMGQRTDAPAQDALKKWSALNDENARLTVAKSLRDQSERLFAERRYKEALDAAQSALRVRRDRAESAQDKEIATDLNNVGVIYLAMGNLDEASNYLNQARARRETLSGNDPDLAVVLLNLAAVSNQRGDTKGAEASYLRALAVRESTLPPSHPLVTESYSQLIGFYEKQNRTAEAQRYRDLLTKASMQKTFK